MAQTRQKKEGGARAFNDKALFMDLYRLCRAGKMTITECAYEFHRHGWDLVVDIERTARRFAGIDGAQIITSHKRPRI